MHSLRAIRKPHDGDGSTATRYNPFAKKRAPSSVGQSNSAQGEGQRDGEQSSAGPESSSSPRSDRLAVSGRATLAAHRDDGAEAMYSATSDDDFRSPTDNDRRRKRRRRIDLWKVHPQWLERMRTSSPASERTVSSTGTSRKRYCSIPLGSQLRAIFLSSRINLLLFAVPAGVALHFLFRHKASDAQSRATFAVNAIAIVPLTAMVSYFTEELALRTGKALGGILNALLGNVTVILIGSFALFRREMVLVKSYMAGTIAFQMVLVLGACFLFGGRLRMEQHFNVAFPQQASTILLLSIGILLLPSAFSYRSSQGGQTELSHATAIILLVTFIAYLYFRLKTHVDLYNTSKPEVPRKKRKPRFESKGEMIAAAEKGIDDSPPEEQGEDSEETPQLTLYVGVIALGVSVSLLGLCSKGLVDSVDGVTRSNTISLIFVGFVLVPLLSNIAEGATAITAAVKDKMDLSIGVCVEASTQITLFVYPFLVTMGWMAGLTEHPLLFDFDGFQSVALFGSGLIPYLLIRNGKSDWLEGAFFVVAYVIIAVAMWFDSPI